MTTQTQTMTTQEIANRLVEFCQKGDYEGAHRELYAEDAVSIEPYASEHFEKETKGLDAIIEKGKKWSAMVKEVHGGSVGEPILANNSFGVTMFMDITMQNGERMSMTELAVYHVKDGKIVAEQFFV